MPNFALKIKAECQNVTNLRPASNEFTVMCYVKCTACHEKHPKVVGITPGEENELSGSRGNANLVMKCNFCKKESSAKFLEPTAKVPLFTPYQVPEDANADFQALCTIEFRGLEPISFDPQGTWACDSTVSKTKFDDVDLTDDFTDYDEAGSAEVSIMEFESKWDRA